MTETERHSSLAAAPRKALLRLSLLLLSAGLLAVVWQRRQSADAPPDSSPIEQSGTVPEDGAAPLAATPTHSLVREQVRSVEQEPNRSPPESEARSILIVEVREELTGAPVIGCLVSLKQRQLPVSSLAPSSDWSAGPLLEVASGRTDEDGNCSLAGAAAGRYEIQLVSDELRAEPVEVELTGQALRLRVLATRLAGLTGLCVDANARPLSMVRVWLRKDSATLSVEGQYSTHTGPQGRFVLKGIPVETGFRYSVRAEHKAYLDRPGRDVTLQPGVSLDTGSFTFRDRKPEVVGFVIHPDGTSAAGLELELERVEDQTTHGTTCDSSGHFRFLDLVPGECVLRADPLCLEGSGSFRFVIGEGSTALDLGILEAREGLRVLSGTVIDGSGAPLPGADVSVGNTKTSTDENGAFSLPFCEIRKRTITARWVPPHEPFEIFVKTDLEAEAFQRPLVLRLIRRGVVFHLVDRQTGGEIHGGVAQFLAKTGRRSRMRSISILAGSQLRYQEIAPGDWQFEVRVEGYRTWSQDLKIGAGVQETERRIEVLLERE